MDQWLIRTEKNLIAGPYTKEQVRQLVATGQLTVKDEVCQANGYWFFLSEREEVIKNLEVEIEEEPLPKEDATETETVLPDERTDPQLAPPTGTHTSSAGSARGGASQKWPGTPDQNLPHDRNQANGHTSGPAKSSSDAKRVKSPALTGPRSSSLQNPQSGPTGNLNPDSQSAHASQPKGLDMGWILITVILGGIALLLGLYFLGQ